MTELPSHSLNLSVWGASWFYWLQLRIASLFHISDQKAFGIALMTVLTLTYLLIISLIALRVAIKTRDRRYKTIHGDSVVLLGPLGSGKTSLFCRISIYASENNPTDAENTLPLPSMTTKVNIASITNAGVGKYTQGKESKSVIGKVIDIPGKVFDTSDVEEYLKNTASIVYMVDGTNYNAYDIAVELYDLFTNKVFLNHPCPLLLAVNKSDLHGCADHPSVYDAIENEIDGLIKNLGDRNILITQGPKFSFESDSPCPVLACNCSVKGDHILKVTSFIHASLH